MVRMFAVDVAIDSEKRGEQPLRRRLVSKICAQTICPMLEVLYLIEMA